MDEHEVRRVARQIFEANRRRERFRPLRGADAPGSMETAYRIQDEVAGCSRSRAASGRSAATRSR